MIKPFSASAAAFLAVVTGVSGATIPLAQLFDTTHSDQYLIIATQVNGPATESNTSNFELGANKAPVPATSGFIYSKPSDVGQISPATGGPGLAGNVPVLPSNAATVYSGIGGHGNIAIIDPQGSFGLSNVGVYADPNIGIRLAGAKQGDGSNLNKASNSFFNDKNLFPNTYDPVTGTGIFVNANGTPTANFLVADQATRIDPSAPNSGGATNVGVTYGFDHTPLKLELTAAQAAINGYAATGILTVTADNNGIPGGQGYLGIETTLTGTGGATISFQDFDLGAGTDYTNDKNGVNATITLQSGLNVIDIFTGGPDTDFQLNNSNLVINGPADAKVIFRLQDDGAGGKGTNLLVSNSNILVGTGGIDDHSILFYTDQQQNDTNFKFNNTILNGVAFWAMGPGQLTVNNAQGCVQFVADTVNLQDVRFNGCAFEGGTAIPEPSGALVGMFLSGVIGIHATGRRRRTRE